jgi:hypothetical protein
MCSRSGVVGVVEVPGLGDEQLGSVVGADAKHRQGST